MGVIPGRGCERLTGMEPDYYPITISNMVTASFKITENQMKELRHAASARRMSISDYLREKTFPKKKEKRPKLLLKRHPVSGWMYNAAPGQRSPTPEKIQEALLSDCI